MQPPLKPTELEQCALHLSFSHVYGGASRNQAAEAVKAIPWVEHFGTASLEQHLNNAEKRWANCICFACVSLLPSCSPSGPDSLHEPRYTTPRMSKQPETSQSKTTLRLGGSGNDSGDNYVARQPASARLLRLLHLALCLCLFCSWLLKANDSKAGLATPPPRTHELEWPCLRCLSR